MTKATPQTIPLPILPPRDAWPRLLRSAADVLQEMTDTQGGFKTLPNEVRLIAGTLEVDDEIRAALSAGKITRATEPYHRAACATPDGLERFRQFVASAPVLRHSPDQTPDLDEEERAVCAIAGITAAEFIAARGGAQ